MPVHPYVGFFICPKGLQMSATDSQLSQIEAAAIKNAARGAKSVTIGDRRVDYVDTVDLLKAKRALAEEENGGIYTTTFTQKGYF